MGSRRRSLIVIGLVVVLLALSGWAIATKPTVQGLDLQGGTELVYQARGTPANPTVEPEDLDQAIEIIRQRVDVLGVAEPEISRVGADQVLAGLPNVANAEEATDQIGDTARLYFYDFEKNVVPQNPNLPEAEYRPYNRLIDAVRAASERKPECARDEDGTPLCTTTKNGTFYLFDKDTLELVSGPAQERSDLFLRYPDRKQPPGTIIENVPQGTVVVRQEPPNDDPNTEVNESQTAPRGWYVLRDRPGLTGDEIRNPEQNFDPTTNLPIVTFEFTDEGRRAFQAVTREIAQRGQAKTEAAGVTTVEQASQISDSFAVVLDGEIESRPIINFLENPDGIDGRTGAQISGNFTVSEAQDLAKILRIGALPVELQLISQSTVSATLGQEALDSAVMAGVTGLLLVILFLLVYYRFLGVVAALGLAVYAVFYLAMIKVIPITLTLPGIAGLILTIGVAADSNIVIFERIKEEVRAGRSMLSAISQGYRRGIATIIDANVCIMITAFILFVLATAGVKGFAFTLGIGTLVALFTAVLFTQAVLGVMGRARFLRSPRFLGAGERRVSWNFDFIGLSKWFFSASGVILLVGALAFAGKGFNFGIDFESGTRITTGLERAASVDQIRTAIADAGIAGASEAEIQSVENDELGDNAFQINAAFTPDDATEVRGVLDREFGIVEFDNTSIGPTFGEQIARSAVIALIFSLLVICAYVAIRFEAKYAVPVLIALGHDVLITAGVYALVGAEVSSATVAAFLTILGYSMYDTIIVFDRIRENVPRMPRAAFSQIVNRSMSEVLTRSLITGLSTVFVVGMLLIFGDETLRGFGLAMMIGIASGTYSSVFIASPVLTEWKEREPAYRARRAQLVEAMGYVPVFPEDNVVARLDGHEGEREPELVGAGPPARGEVPAAVPDAAPPTGAPETAPLAEPRPSEPVAGPPDAPERDGPGAAGEPAAEPAAAQAKRAERERRRQRNKRRRKHGRHR